MPTVQNSFALLGRAFYNVSGRYRRDARMSDVNAAPPESPQGKNFYTRTPLYIRIIIGLVIGAILGTILLQASPEDAAGKVLPVGERPGL